VVLFGNLGHFLCRRLKITPSFSTNHDCSAIRRQIMQVKNFVKLSRHKKLKVKSSTRCHLVQKEMKVHHIVCAMS